MAVLIPSRRLLTGFVEYPLSDFDDTPGLFEQGDEVIRYKHPTTGMTPAKQRFNRDGFESFGGEERLVGAFELARFGGDVGRFVPPAVVARLKAKADDERAAQPRRRT